MDKNGNNTIGSHENSLNSSINTETIFQEDVMEIISKKVKYVRYNIGNTPRLGITVSKKNSHNIDFSVTKNSSDCVICLDDKQRLVSCHKMLGKKSNILLASPITYSPDVPIYTPLYNSANDPYNDIFKGNVNLSISNSEVLINNNNKKIPIEKRGRGRKKSPLILAEDNVDYYYNYNPNVHLNINLNSYSNNNDNNNSNNSNNNNSNNSNNNNNKPKTTSHPIKFSDGTTQNVISKSGTIPKDIDKAYREYNELKFLTVECNKCHNIVYKNDTFNDIMNNVVCARCASTYDFNDLYDWSDKDKDEKGWIMCKRCHKKRGKPLSQFLKIDQKGLITIQNTCRNCLLKKCVQYIKDRPFCNSSITNKISPPINLINNNNNTNNNNNSIGSINNSQSVLLVSQERQSILDLENRLNKFSSNNNNIPIPTTDTTTTTTTTTLSTNNNNNNSNTSSITPQQVNRVESILLNSKPFPMFNEISSSSSLSSLERKDKNSTVTLQQINNKIEEVVIPTPDNSNINNDNSSSNSINEPPPPTLPTPSSSLTQPQQLPPPPLPPPLPLPSQQQQQQQIQPSILSSQTIPAIYNPTFDEPLRTRVIEMEKIQSNKSAKELKEQKGNKNIGFDPYEYEFKDKKRFVISKVGVLPQKLDEALVVYQYNFGVKIQCFYCRDVRLRNDCFIDKEGNYICFDCSLKDIKKSGELYDWADRESDPKAVHILCKRCHKKCGKTLDQFLKLDQKDNVIILNTCRNCLLKKNYDYKKNSEFSKPSHHSIYRSPVPNPDIISIAFLNSVNNEFGINGDTFKIVEKKSGLYTNNNNSSNNANTNSNANTITNASTNTNTNTNTNNNTNTNTTTNTNTNASTNNNDNNNDNKQKLPVSDKDNVKESNEETIKQTQPPQSQQLLQEKDKNEVDNLSDKPVDGDKKDEETVDKTEIEDNSDIKTKSEEVKEEEVKEEEEKQEEVKQEDIKQGEKTEKDTVVEKNEEIVNSEKQKVELEEKKTES